MKLSQLMKNKFFLFIILFGILEPRCVKELSVYKGGVWTIWHRIDVLLIYAGTLFIIAVSLFLFHKISMIGIAVILYQACWIFSDIYNGLSIFSDFRNAIQMIALVLLIDLACKLEFKIRLLDTMSFILGLFILINFITILVYPDGMYVDDRNWTANWFFGYKNSHIYIYLLYIVCSALRDFMKYGHLKLRYYLMVAIMLTSSVLADTDTTMVIMAMIAALIIFFHSVKLPKWINGITAMGASALLSFLFIFTGIQTYFSNILEALFQKTATFSGRTSIWSIALLKIASKPILGNGNSYVSTTLYSTWDVGQCHNNFLDILFVGGVVLMALFIWIQFLTCSKMLKKSGTLAANILTFVWIGYSILFIFEARRNDSFVYAVYAFAYNIQYFDVNPEILSKVTHRRRKKVKVKFALDG